MDGRPVPRHGDIWQAVLDSPVGHEQAGIRPVIIVSVDLFNRNPSRLALAVPVTRRDRSNPLHVAIAPSPGGFRHLSFALCEAIRSISTDRLQYRVGSVEDREMEEIQKRLRRLLGL